MQIKPIIYLASLSEHQIAEYECSDNIWLPTKEFTKW